MKPFFNRLCFLLSLTLLHKINASAQQLDGRIDNSDVYGSGWIDLANITDFREGDTLVITIGGTAKDIYVRLLRKGADPTSREGITGGVRRVPSNKVVTVVLDTDRREVVQISVHGRNAWKLIADENNGPATLVSVVLKRNRIRN